MLEILLLITFCKRIGRIVAAKGRAKIGYQLMVVLFWFGGEFFGAVLGVIAEIIISGREEPTLLSAYVCGLAFAALGAYVAFLIARNVTPLNVEVPMDDSYSDRWHRTADSSDLQRPGEPPGSREITDRPL